MAVDHHPGEVEMPSRGQTVTMRRRTTRAASQDAATGSDSEEEFEGDTVQINHLVQEHEPSDSRTQESEDKLAKACSATSTEVSGSVGEENMNEEMVRLRSELERENGARLELEHEKNVLEAQIEAVMKDFDAKLQGKGQEIGALNGMNAHLQTQVNELQCLLNEEKGKTSGIATTSSSVAASPSLVMKELQNKVANLEEELANGEELLTGLESENEAIRKDLEEAHSNIQELDDERREIQSQIKALEKELESAVVEINDLKATCKRRGESESSLKVEMSTYLQRIKELENQVKEHASVDTIATQHAEIEAVKCASQELKAEIEQKEELITSLRSQLSGATATIQSKTEAARSPSETELKALRDAAFAAARVMELEQELGQLKTKSAGGAPEQHTSGGNAEKTHEVLTDSKQEKDALVRELNCLAEEKLVLKSRAEKAENEARRAREDFDATQQELRRAQELVSALGGNERAKEKEIVEVRSEAVATRDALIDSQKQVKKLEKKVAAMEAEASKKEDVLAELENDLFQLKQEAEAASNDTSSHQVSSLQAEVQQLADDLKAKNSRIERLEKSKLTKDQLDKIKAIKEEKVRLAKENKRLAAQLEAPPSSGGDGGGGADMKDMQVQLKDKAFQVEEYEKERQNILRVLEKEGFDITKHQDSSFNLESTMDHSDLCISSSLAGIIDNLRRDSQKFSDSVQ